MGSHAEDEVAERDRVRREAERARVRRAKSQSASDTDELQAIDAEREQRIADMGGREAARSSRDPAPAGVDASEASGDGSHRADVPQARGRGTDLQQRVRRTHREAGTNPEAPND